VPSPWPFHLHDSMESALVDITLAPSWIRSPIGRLAGSGSNLGAPGSPGRNNPTSGNGSEENQRRREQRCSGLRCIYQHVGEARWYIRAPEADGCTRWIRNRSSFLCSLLLFFLGIRHHRTPGRSPRLEVDQRPPHPILYKYTYFLLFRGHWTLWPPRSQSASHRRCGLS